MKTRIAIRIAALVFGLIIIAAVVIANLGYGESFWPIISYTPNADKVGHIGIFGILGFLSNLALPNFRIRHLPRLVTAITFFLFVLVSLEEISQAFIPSRVCDVFDWLADVAGLAIGQIAATVLSRFLPKQETSNT
jgi:VanZ family protein